ncbi:hypothetical protein LOZ39_005248 [Ophidiomyces ophidiicola]|nr:hypothetical protein LOZ64_005602 [Ophidiomyces ophidiicola]KAI2000098.1 hypothetical protein LOZ50_006230 [Ophidiomyces ophidiicola]KAI2015733.1 hypothetical protein LOZ46_005216 [Ophidiomyces ophidiicola]KAI2021872.1 hypothetical protein LOZ45_004589 [Ophidiomyces ophidiicola]KAI2069728.1 hypothetical protein LOZ39_005248 [Ophidiomyces ophidiicola]
MSGVRSQNPYDILGNDEADEPQPPAKALDKNAPRHGKRDAPVQPRGSNPALARGGQRYSGNERALRDGAAGSRANRSRPTEDEPRSGPAHVGGTKNRDQRGHLIRDDRRSKTDRTITGKQLDQGWGATTGESNMTDEKAGEAIAKNDEKEAAAAAAEEGEGGATPDDKEPEPQDKTKSYADYLAELDQNKRDDLGIKEARKPNEGAKVDKKWAAAKEFKRDDEDDDYIKGREEKARREKQRKEKNVLDVDMRFVEPARRGGDFRGRGRGGADRGGRGGGGARGGAPGGGRGEYRPRGGAGPQGPTVDERNFPSLGAK